MGGKAISILIVAALACSLHTGCGCGSTELKGEADVIAEDDATPEAIEDPPEEEPSIPLPECGNGILEAGEECDGADHGSESCESMGFTAGVLSCTSDCSLDTLECTLCGNDLLETGEACDGTDLGGLNCTDLGHTDGSLRCSSDCTHDVSMCSTCGNGLIELDEECDNGSSNSDTTPDACRTDCTDPVCGDGVADSSEDCDIPDLAGETCETLDRGFTHGVLDCSTACAFDVSLCATCGNGIMEYGEDCDDGSANSDILPDRCRTDCTNPGCGDLVIDTGEECDDGNVVEWDGCRLCLIAEFMVNADDALNDMYSSVAMHNDARVIVSWSGLDSPGGRYHDYAQLFSPSGLPIATEFTTDTGYPPDSVSRRAPAFFGDGDFLLAWAGGGTDLDAILNIHHSTGYLIYGPLRANTHLTNSQHWTAADASPDGESIVVWTSQEQDGSWGGIFGQRFNSDGTHEGTEFQVNTYWTNEQGHPSVKMFPDGSFIVVWHSREQDGDGDAVVLKRYDTSGAPIGAERIVNTYTASSQREPDIAGLDDGSFIVVWESMGQDGDAGGIFAQRFNSTGMPIGAEFQVSTHTTDHQNWPRIGMAGDGTFVVAWASDEQDGDGMGVFGQRFDASGASIGTEFRANTFTTNDQQYADVAVASDGRFIIVWMSYEQDGTNEHDVFAQRYDASGTPLGTLPW